MNELLSARKISNTYVTIRFVSMEDSGMCSVSDDESNTSPKCFDMDISGKMSIKRTLITLAHEMVHLRQFRDNELMLGFTKSRFRGKTYSIDHDYDDQPWEKEAYELENVLYEKFVKECM